MNRFEQARQTLTRRWFFQECGVGLGAVALGSLLGGESARAASPTRSTRWPRRPRTYPAKAKRVIYLFQAGAPEPPRPVRRQAASCASIDGTLPPAELLKGYRAAFINPSSTLLAPKFKFGKHGQSGAELSELLPHLGEVVDDVAIVKSMVTDAFNHAPAQIFMNTGSQQFGRPSMGSWTTYGLGTEGAGPAGLRRLQHRPEGDQRRRVELGLRLPADRPSGRAVPRPGRPGPLPLEPAGRRRRDPAGLDRRRRRARTAQHLGAVGDPEIATRINNFELAYRMQSGAPDLMDLSQGDARDPGHVRRRAGQVVLTPTPACSPDG